VLGQLVLALMISTGLRGDPAAAGHADVPDDPQQRAAGLAGGPELAGQRLVPVQLQRGAVERGDLQAAPQDAQPEPGVACFRVDLEQAGTACSPSRSLARDSALPVGTGPGQNRSPGIPKALASTWS